MNADVTREFQPGVYGYVGDQEWYPDTLGAMGSFADKFTDRMVRPLLDQFNDEPLFRVNVGKLRREIKHLFGKRLAGKLLRLRLESTSDLLWVDPTDWLSDPRPVQTSWFAQGSMNVQFNAVYISEALSLFDDDDEITVRAGQTIEGMTECLWSFGQEKAQAFVMPMAKDGGKP